MEAEADLPAPLAEAKFFEANLSRPINVNPDSVSLSHSFSATSTYTSTSWSSSSSPPDLVRNIQAAFKRHRSLGTMQSNGIRPRRCLVPHQDASRDSNSKSYLTLDAKNSKENVSQAHQLKVSGSPSKNMVFAAAQNQEDASMSQPSGFGSTVNTLENLKPLNAQLDQPGLSARSGSNYIVAVETGNVPEVQKKVHFATDDNATSGKMEWNVGNQLVTSATASQDLQHYDIKRNGMDNSLSFEGGISSMLATKTMGNQDQLHHFRNVFQDDLNNAMRQSSAFGPSCVTLTLIDSTAVPMTSSTMCFSQTQISSGNLGTEPAGEAEVQKDVVQSSCSLSKYAGEVFPHQSAVSSQSMSSNAVMRMEVKKSSDRSKEQQDSVLQENVISKNCSHEDNKSNKGNVINTISQPPSTNLSSSDAKLENSKLEKQGRDVSGRAESASRKKGYDPDLFFKVNGKFYQRLGKIGSGGSSEVHKVISSDCKIYALKKIKLKGHDHATAYGFCQEMKYLNTLRGKSNIIQLIDYEVSDKTLLQDAMNDSLSNKDYRIKHDAYIYMVLEYGEIDLAHMLSQKWKELDGSNTTIDENWLRFYWQQILLAVNTIHEERIVHSDLKPANFLLVRGCLKLIDFGIAKAIMSDTTHIQRDSQVGTLSYMSPEAFMCNETDANGNIIKCGRPSDIWSLGCILYQMVYGRTPFSEYKTFWAKFKVITDPNHEIIYELVSNPWLLDLMKKCLAWDMNERWRIPQLLQHPFLVPPIPPQFPCPLDQSCKLFELIAESGGNNHETLMLCSQLQNMLMDPRSVVLPDSSISRNQQRKLLCNISTLCLQLQEHLANL